MNDYGVLFSENMDLLLQLNEHEIISSWSGQFRSSLRHAEIAPRPLQERIPIWIGVGGSEESAERAGRLGVGMVMAILGGHPLRFQQLAELYRKVGTESGHASERLRLGVTGHGYIAPTLQQAKDEFYPYYSNYSSYVGRQLGKERVVAREDFEQMVAPNTALFVGGPQEIIEKIMRQYELFNHNRFMVQLDVGGLPFSNVVRAIELLATEVAPTIRKEMRKNG